MKTVRQQVLDKYSKFDLSNKKDFIKATVKEVIVVLWMCGAFLYPIELRFLDVMIVKVVISYL